MAPTYAVPGLFQDIISWFTFDLEGQYKVMLSKKHFCKEEPTFTEKQNVDISLFQF